jgi:hypothetical protein
MSDVKWWMDAGCRWHQGTPPAGWWQARDGRWRPPASDDTTEEVAIGPPPGAAHLAAASRWSNLWATYRGWPLWARLAAPAAAVILVIGVLGTAAMEGFRGDDGEVTATDTPTTTQAPESTATSTHAAIPGPAAGGPITTHDSDSSTTAPPERDTAPTTVGAAPGPAPPTTAEPPANVVRQSAPCSPEGATAVTADGISVVCTTQKCHGAPFSEPRWRRAGC